MNNWYIIDTIIVLVYASQHTLFTTRIAMDIYNKVFPAYLWNILYSIISIILIVVGLKYWQPSNVYIYKLVPGGILYHISIIMLSLSLFLFFYCFKYTTSFIQWIGIKQIIYKIKNRSDNGYHRVRNNGVKKYIRFPHHTCLIIFFWSHPLMTFDTLLLSIACTVYLYIGTYHQDIRGIRILGKEWEDYRINTSLLIPSLSVISIIISDIKKYYSDRDDKE